jgi:phosphatidylglycerol:prolipoprotein diacylglycerol transferase
LTLTHNTGIAFGLLEGRGWLTIPLTLCVAGGLVWYQCRHKPPRGVQLLTGLLLGGALGNFVDRLRMGYVVDMFDFTIWPVFNVADMAITCSLLGLMALQFVGARATPTAAGVFRGAAAMMPELVRIGGLTLYTYGFMWVVGIWLAVWWGLRRASRYGVSPDDALDIAFWSVLTGIVGGRVAFVLTNWSQYAPDPLSVLRVWEGGMSYFGGFGLAIATAIYIIRKRRIPIWQLGDLAAPSLALGYGIARIGCFAAGCCYGAPTDLPWGVLFPEHTHPVHPTQLYATGMNLLIFAGLILV